MPDISPFAIVVGTIMVGLISVAIGAIAVLSERQKRTALQIDEDRLRTQREGELVQRQIELLERRVTALESLTEGAQSGPSQSANQRGKTDPYIDGIQKHA